MNPLQNFSFCCKIIGTLPPFLWEAILYADTKERLRVETMDDLLTLPDIQDKWEDILDFMKKEYSIQRASFDTWLRALAPYTIEQAAKNGEYLIIIAIDDTKVGASSKTYIIDQYNAKLKCSIETICLCSCTLSFLLNSELDAYSKEQEKQENIQKKETYVSDDVDEFLNPHYTFDTFVVGNRNALAHAASLAVAESPAQVYNPLFIYGGVGLGKTHLMHSIAHFIKENTPDLKVLYISSETFTNELVTAIRTARTDEFQRKYRKIDVLLIDDIQFVVGKESTQEEFFHTFNTLKESKKQIVISSDRPPRDMETLEDRLRSRFAAGLVVDVGQPDYETRLAILKKKVELDNIDLDNDDVFEYIATNITSNIRELEGCLTKIVALSRLKQREITLGLAEEALKDLISSSTRDITVDLIIDIVADHYNISASDLLSSKRSRNISYPRQICMYLCREYTHISLDEIGAKMGRRDHSTIMHGIKKITEDLEKDDDTLKEALILLSKKIGS